MEPDWYVDPLGRFEGRYFDGEQWTDQVKLDGRLAADPDFPPAEQAMAASAESSASADAFSTAAVVEGVAPEQPVGAGAVGPDDRSETDWNAAAAAVTPIATSTTASQTPEPSQIDYSVESPARPVAVLGDEADKHLPAFQPKDHEFDLGPDEKPSGRKWVVLLGLALLAVLLAALLLPRLFDSDGDIADPVDGEETTAQVDDTAATDSDVVGDDTDATADATDDSADDPVGDTAPDNQADPDVPDDQAETTEPDQADDGAEEPTDAAPAAPAQGAIDVGVLTVDNGNEVLQELRTWHRDFAASRDVELGADADCWFGSIGDAVVQNAHCGPTAQTPGAEPRFDLIPLRFDDIADDVISVTALTDAVVTDAVLPSGLSFSGANGTVDPADFAISADAARGIRQGD